jgi:hypothetical protein
MAKKRRKQMKPKSDFDKIKKKLDTQRMLINSLDTTKFTPAQ